MPTDPERYTPVEQQILNMLGSASDLFSSLPRQHPSEVMEFMIAVHAAQTLVMARFAQRREASGITPIKGVRNAN